MRVVSTTACIQRCCAWPRRGCAIRRPAQAARGLPRRGARPPRRRARARRGRRTSAGSARSSGRADSGGGPHVRCAARHRALARATRSSISRSTSSRRRSSAERSQAGSARSARPRDTACPPTGARARRGIEEGPVVSSAARDGVADPRIDAPQPVEADEDVAGVKRVHPAEVARLAVRPRPVGALGVERPVDRPLDVLRAASAPPGDVHQPGAEQVRVVDVHRPPGVVGEVALRLDPQLLEHPAGGLAARGPRDRTAPCRRRPRADRWPPNAVTTTFGTARRIEAPARLHVPGVAPRARARRSRSASAGRRRAGRARAARRRRVRRCARASTDPKIPSALGISGWRRR